MSETPRADAARIVAYGEGGIENGVGFSCVPLKEVRQLERELNEALERERVAIASWDEERQRASREGERVIEANADRLRLWEALKRCKADRGERDKVLIHCHALDQSQPPPVVAKADADALADALEKALHDSSSGKSWYVREACVETLETYRAKYPTA